MVEYIIVDGTSYHKETPADLIRVLEQLRKEMSHIILSYGDVKTGKVWIGITPNSGFIDRTSGPIKVPIILRTLRSSGGVPILAHCIFTIQSNTNKTIYERRLSS